MPTHLATYDLYDEIRKGNRNIRVRRRERLHRKAERHHDTQSHHRPIRGQQRPGRMVGHLSRVIAHARSEGRTAKILRKREEAEGYRAVKTIDELTII